MPRIRKNTDEEIIVTEEARLQKQQEQTFILQKLDNFYWEKKRRWILRAVIFVATVSVGFALYLNNQVTSLKNDPAKAAQEEIKKYVADISRSVVLPQNETPTLATISDPEKLKDQAFFKKAKKGDKVLIYKNAKKIILYDPEAKKVVEIAPIDVGGTGLEGD